MRVSKSRNNKVGTPEAAGQLLAAIYSRKTIKANLVSNVPEVLGDSFEDNRIDVADLDGFFSRSNKLGSALLAHIIAERRFAVGSGSPGEYSPAHSHALKVESAIMGGDTRKAIFQEGSGPGAILNMIYMKKNKIIGVYKFKLDGRSTPR